MNSLPSISHRLFAAAAGPAPAAGSPEPAWSWHTVPGSKILNLEVVGDERAASRPKRPTRRLQAWPGKPGR
jgi:hypothetical protein